jgi:hypothetical protein
MADKKEKDVWDKLSAVAGRVASVHSGFGELEFVSWQVGAVL